ncbi:HAUS augmin-like complex subunit 2 [Denticeps clupeoides]|uniref:HAUS augmin-like complex subunit 2 n=1 Tax=Denticeps clupeoides TaxID=299321 RepID=UPI0010A47E23|nr:HAUS augmin-like complex subunit 2 [Denticeps clupeoides]XP_028833580.1 HAUS augmin-like complex subunit 2 [Denticeps clupeoides]XP_028845444.1 HAUS augmin-like complex subunit 2 [Denticeps clupeoides]
MNLWEAGPYAVTPAAKILARCVSSGAVDQEHLDSLPRDSRVFSSRLDDAVTLSGTRREIQQSSLQLELLKLEQEFADVTHNHYLSQRFEALQKFCSHLQDVLREQARLKQRLMKPLCQQNLPIQADLHRYVVELTGMAVEFIGNLEDKMKTVQLIPNTGESMNNLNTATTQLLVQVMEVEKLSKQILQWRDKQQAMNSDGCT